MLYQMSYMYANQSAKLIGLVSVCYFSRAAIALFPHIVGGNGIRTRTSVSTGHVSKQVNPNSSPLVSRCNPLRGTPGLRRIFIRSEMWVTPPCKQRSQRKPKLNLSTLPQLSDARKLFLRFKMEGAERVELPA